MITPCNEPSRSLAPLYCRGGGRYRSAALTSEFELIERLRKRFAAIGDDSAVVDPPNGPLLLAADALVAGVHGNVDDGGLEEFGWRAVVVNVSDIAAMGGRPLHLLVTVAAPPDTRIEPIFDGIESAAEAYRCPVVGGDLTNGPCLVVTVAVTGTVDDGEPVRRSGARAGDRIFVTGPLGAAAASRWARRPVARVEEGVAARRAGATAMIDVSDGLAADLGHIADESGVGTVVDHVPVADGASEQEAVNGGEDYELVFTAPVDELPFAIRIGRCTADPSDRLDGRGWEHRFG